MIRSMIFALAAIGLAATSQAAVMITSEGTPTVGKEGFTTWTVTATSDGAPIQGFDFVGDPSAPVDPATSKGFFGPMNQVTGGPITSNVFQDQNAFFGFLPGTPDVSQDSQFKFMSNALIVIPGSATESPTSLRAAFSSSNPLGNSVAFAQIVLANASLNEASYFGTVGTSDGLEFDVRGAIGSVVEIPEPATLALAGLALIGLVGFRRRK